MWPPCQEGEQRTPLVALHESSQEEVAQDRAPRQDRQESKAGDSHRSFGGAQEGGKVPCPTLS